MRTETSRSRTSDWVSALRALYSEAPADLSVVDDSVALMLLPRGLRGALRVCTAVPLGTRALHRVLGGVSLGLTYGVPLRTAAIDARVRRDVRRGVRQLVLLGAGLDARAWRMPELEHSVVYELDHPATQAFKRERIQGTAALARDVRFAPVDFERDGLASALERVGFRRDEPGIWVWEGVSMYLSREAVDHTLDAVAELAAPESTLAMTYVPPNYAARWLKAVGRAAFLGIGEPLNAELEPAELARQLSELGFRVDADDTALEWAREYWPEREARRVRAWERLAVATKAQPSSIS